MMSDRVVAQRAQAGEHDHAIARTRGRRAGSGFSDRIFAGLTAALAIKRELRGDVEVQVMSPTDRLCSTRAEF
jgi:hypothetical protein